MEWQKYSPLGNLQFHDQNLSNMALSSLSLDGLIRYSNGLFVLVYLVSMAAAVKLFTGPARWLAVIATLLSLAMYLILGPAALYSLGLVIGFGVLDFWKNRHVNRWSKLQENE